MKSYKSGVKKVYISEARIKRTVKRLARQINRDYAGKNLLLLCILKGSVVFLADLMRELKIPCRVDFMVASSYGKSTESTGVLEIKYDLQIEVDDYDILIIEDIIDSGNTLYNLKNHLLARNPKSVRICTLLDKPSRREAKISADYVGIEIKNEFVIGYGLDFADQYRALPYVGIYDTSLLPPKTEETEVSDGEAAVETQTP